MVVVSGGVEFLWENGDALPSNMVYSTLFSVDAFRASHFPGHASSSVCRSSLDVHLSRAHEFSTAA